MDEKKRFKRIKKGNKKAFERLYRKHYKNLVRFVWSYVRSEAVAKELVQDLFLKIWEEGRELDIEESVKSYLYSSARNMSIDYLRHKEVEISWREEKKALFDFGRLPQIDERLHKKMLLEEIRDAILKLPERRREIFMLSRYEEMSYKEIADFLGISVHTVKTQIGRTLRKLREIIDTLAMLLASAVLVVMLHFYI